MRLCPGCSVEKTITVTFNLISSKSCQAAIANILSQLPVKSSLLLIVLRILNIGLCLITKDTDYKLTCYIDNPLNYPDLMPTAGAIPNCTAVACKSFTSQAEELICITTKAMALVFRTVKVDARLLNSLCRLAFFPCLKGARLELLSIVQKCHLL